MDLEFSIIDKETGKTVISGKITGYRVNYSRNSIEWIDGITEYIGPTSKTVNIEGVCFLGAPPEQPKVCEHQWHEYRGLKEQFEVCGLCGVKK